MKKITYKKNNNIKAMVIIFTLLCTQISSTVEAESFLGGRSVRMGLSATIAALGAGFWWYSNREMKKLEIEKNSKDEKLSASEIEELAEKIKEYKNNSYIGLGMAAVGAGWFTAEGAVAVWNKLKRKNGKWVQAFPEGFPAGVGANDPKCVMLSKMWTIDDLKVRVREGYDNNLSNNKASGYSFDVLAPNGSLALIAQIKCGDGGQTRYEAIAEVKDLTERLINEMQQRGTGYGDRIALMQTYYNDFQRITNKYEYQKYRDSFTIAKGAYILFAGGLQWPH